MKVFHKKNNVQTSIVSESEKPKAYSPVNLFARVVGDARVLIKVGDGETIRVARVEK